MAYSPNDSERSIAALVQGMASVLLFLPALAGMQMTIYRQSPYVHYWVKVNLIWSILATVLVLATVVTQHTLDVSGLICTAVLTHLVLCVMGAFAATFNLPFAYLFVATVFCKEEWLALRQPPRSAADPVDDDE